MVKKYQVNKKKVKKIVVNGHAHVNSTFNNTVVTFSDEQGNTLCWSTSGANGFKGSRKSTPYAAQLAGDAASKKALGFGMKNAQVFVKGPGAGRESALRAISAAGINVTMIKDITPIPHNGCRPKKKRRV